jgi:hypothetical protein
LLLLLQTPPSIVEAETHPVKETKTRFNRKPSKKAAPVRRVALSTEEQRAYEALAQERGKRESDYGRHLPRDAKTR